MEPGSEPVPLGAAFSTDSDFGTLFHAHYPRIARVIVRILQDPARAEEIAVDVFWKLWCRPALQNENPGGWLYRVAVRAGLDELRRQQRRQRIEQMFTRKPPALTPEQLHTAAQSEEQVRQVLWKLKKRDSELLILRSEGLSYQEIAESLGLNPASIGKLMTRAQQAFRKEYFKRYENRTRS